MSLADFVVVLSYIFTAARWAITRLRALCGLYKENGPGIPSTTTPQTVKA